MKYLTNVHTYICEDCEEVFKVYSTSGETNFCPYCGSDGRQLHEYKEKVSE